MAEYEITVGEAVLSNLLSGRQEGLAELLEVVLNQVLEAQAEEQLGAGRYERFEARRDTGTATVPVSSTAGWDP